MEAAAYMHTARYDPAFTKEEVNKTENLLTYAAYVQPIVVPSSYHQEIAYPA